MIWEHGHTRRRKGDQEDIHGYGLDFRSDHITSEHVNAQLEHPSFRGPLLSLSVERWHLTQTY